MPGRVSGMVRTSAPTHNRGGSESASGGGKDSATVYFNITYSEIKKYIQSEGYLASPAHAAVLVSRFSPLWQPSQPFFSLALKCGEPRV